MKIKYIIQKVIRKVMDSPCINDSVLNKTVRVDVGAIVVGSSMGKYSYIGEHSSLLYADVGAFTCISNYCAIGGGSHPIDWVSMSPVFNTSSGIIKRKLGYLDYNPFQRVRIGNDVWIGSHSLIKSGVTISDGVVIGMGSVVTHDVGPYEIWAGNPAKMIRKRFDTETIEEIKKSAWWNWDDSKIEELVRTFNNPQEFISILRKYEAKK